MSAAILPSLLACVALASETLVIEGGRLFDGVTGELRPNVGIVVRGGKILAVDTALEGSDEVDVRVQLDDDRTVLPGLFDLHAHYAMDLVGGGRVDETVANPRLFLANGVTTTFPAGEVDPEKMRALRIAIDSGEVVGPRILSSGPYFGRWRKGWKDGEMDADRIRAEVDHWAELGVRGFKAKLIRADHLRVLIERAHRHGLTVTAHLDSGFQRTVNPRDAIEMGIDRVEHFLGGDALPADRPAYAVLPTLDPDTDAFRRIARLFIERHVYFDATLTAYGYFGGSDSEVFEDFADERSFFTPYVREYVADNPQKLIPRFDRIFRVKLRTLKAFVDLGGGDLVTLGSDHPSWGEYLAAFGVHRELHAFVVAGIPPAQALSFATVNAARAMDCATTLGTIEPGKLADFFVVAGNPLEDIRATRDVRLVVKAGELHDPRELLGPLRGSIGPHSRDEEDAWRAR